MKPLLLHTGNITVCPFTYSHLLQGFSTSLPGVALHVIEHLGVMFPDHARLTPTPSMEYVDHQMQLECLRRIFWHIHFMDLMFSTFTQQPLFTRPPDAKLALKLPLSETYFELAVTNILPGTCGRDHVHKSYTDIPCRVLAFGTRQSSLLVRIRTSRASDDHFPRNRDGFKKCRWLVRFLWKQLLHISLACQTTRDTQNSPCGQTI